MAVLVDWAWNTKQQTYFYSIHWLPWGEEVEQQGSQRVVHSHQKSSQGLQAALLVAEQGLCPLAALPASLGPLL